MKLRKTLIGAARELKNRLVLYRAISKHPDTPRAAKWLLGAAIGYLLLPFDLIPDFIPGIGQLDDLIIVPLLFVLAMRLIPPGVVEQCTREIEQRQRMS